MVTVNAFVIENYFSKPIQYLFTYYLIGYFMIWTNIFHFLFHRSFTVEGVENFYWNLNFLLTLIIIILIFKKRRLFILESKKGLKFFKSNRRFWLKFSCSVFLYPYEKIMLHRFTKLSYLNEFSTKVINF